MLNIYESIPDENNMWNYYGKVLRYVAEEKRMEAEYHGFIKENELLSKVDFTGGFAYIHTDKQEKIPAAYSQQLRLYDVYGEVNKKHRDRQLPAPVEYPRGLCLGQGYSAYRK